MRPPLNLRTGLLAAAIGSAATVFFTFLLYETPGLGLAHFYYVSIILAALATGPGVGAVAGATATALYATDVVLNPSIPSAEVLSTSTAIRLVTFVTVGTVTGYFAHRNRALVAELQLLAERDALTGLPNTRAFEQAVTARLLRDEPFALLVGDIDSLSRLNEEEGRRSGDDMLRQIADRLLRELDPDDEVARIGADEFAVLTFAQSTDEAARLATSLQRSLAHAGYTVTFGWAAFPQDGTNALSLYRAADERLYARKIVLRDRGNVVPLRERPVAADA